MRRLLIPWLLLLCAWVPGIVAAQTGQISGRVTDTGGIALSGVDVHVYQKTSSGGYTLSGSASTDASGNYIVTALPAGTYYLQTSNSAGYVDELYNDVPCPSSTSIANCPAGAGEVVMPGTTTPNIDFALALGGRISGRVTDGMGTGLVSVVVKVYLKTSSGPLMYVGATATDVSGNYITRAGLTTGIHYVTTLNTAGYVDELYDNVPCLEKPPPTWPPCDFTSGTGVFVVQGGLRPNIDFLLVKGGKISGRVTDAGGVGLPNVYVIVYQKTPGGGYTYATQGYTDATGNYEARLSLPTGTYYLQTLNTAGYLDELYDDVPCAVYPDSCPAGTPVSVTEGVTTNINFALAPGGRISGRVTGAAGNGLSNVLVTVYRRLGAGSHSGVTSGRTDAAGNYTTGTGLPTGTYYLRTANSQGYVDEIYDNVPCMTGSCNLDSGTGVSVTQGMTTPNIDFALMPERIVLPAGDYDGDRKADVAVFRPSTGVWYIIPSSTGTPVGISWGQSGDVPAPGDYDGDGRTDAAVFRPSTGMWYVLQTSTKSGVGLVWGVAGDVPVPGDYDGDRKADIAVFRPSTGMWYIVRSGAGTAIGIVWGQAGDVPVAGDFDGDGKADPTVFRPASGTWYELRSTTGSGFGLVWGQSGDVPVPGDFDGDRKADPTVFRASVGTWFQLRSTTGAGFGVSWGASGDQPTGGDYDGDGRADPTVFRSINGTWYQLRTTSGVGFGIVWGTSGDWPL